MLIPDIRIKGKQIFLRPIKADKEDTDLIIGWRNSDTVRPYFIYQKPFTREGHEQWLKDMIMAGKGHQFMVCDLKDEKPIGSTYFRDIDPDVAKAEFGFFIGEEKYRNRGIGSEILNLMTDFGFHTLKFHKIFARAFADNAPSVNCFLKNGFRQEACLKDEVLINHQYRDILLLAKFDYEGTVFIKEREENEENSQFCDSLL